MCRRRIPYSICLTEETAVNGICNHRVSKDNHVTLRIGSSHLGKLSVQPGKHSRVINYRLGAVRSNAKDMVTIYHTMPCLIIGTHGLVNVSKIIVVTEYIPHISRIRSSCSRPAIIRHVVIADGIYERNIDRVKHRLECRLKLCELGIVRLVDEVSCDKHCIQTVLVLLESLGL